MRVNGGGRIIHISSAVGHTVLMPGMVDYGTAKAALLAFSRTMAIELAPDNILVNSVCPGFIMMPLGGELAEQSRPILGSTHPGRSLSVCVSVAEGNLKRCQPLQISSWGHRSVAT